MQPGHPLVSINILTYNGEKYIRDCLESALNQTYFRTEILVVDNCSTDKTRDYLKNYSEKIKVILNDKQTGFSVGQNQAIRESKGELILCLNQDVVLEKDFLYYAVRMLEKDNQVSAVQGRVLRFNEDGSPSKRIDTTGLVMLKNRRIINRGQGEIDEGQFGKTEEVFGADGACPVYRREALEDIKIDSHYFDEDFFAYKEDVDLAWRMRLAGWKNIYQPEAVAWHWRGSGDSARRSPWGIIKERQKISNLSKYLAFKNQRLMQLKNEQVGLLIKHLPWIIPKEIGAWAYVLLFERYTWPAIRDLFRQAPKAWQKRKFIMANIKRVDASKINKWFN